ncbi:GAP family protein [Microbacterium sp.]|uniref:GAP family protein n=1 Tax=Microbacterium sp. TaxID=51671 RepID=UPI003F9DEFDC
MLHLLAELFTIGIGVAISPLAIVAVILMATSGKGRSNGTAFIIGCYVFSVVFVSLCVLLGRSAGSEDADSGAHVTVDVVEIVLGLLLVGLAVMQWRNRNHTGTPKWMNALDGMSIWQAFIAGVLISGPLSPKDLPLLIAAGGRISQSTLLVNEIVIVILIFAFIGVLAVTVPWLISVVSPSKVEVRLSGARDWLVANHSVIMTILFIILGAKLIGSGVADLVY